MEPADNGIRDQELLKLQYLLSETRGKLTEALGQVDSIAQSIIDSEEEEDNHRQTGSQRILSHDLSETALAELPPKEREAALKRAKNRQAARRSRQRKNERINNLYKEIHSLQEENLLLLKCIEEFTLKAVQSKTEQALLQQQLEVLHGTRSHADNPRMALNTASLNAAASIPQRSLIPLYHPDHRIVPESATALIPTTYNDTNNNDNDMDEEEDVILGMEVDHPTQELLHSQPKPTSSSIHPLKSSPVKSLTLPSREELQRLQNSSDGSSQHTARGNTPHDGQLSARAALSEHMAMLSKDNSPREDEPAEIIHGSNKSNNNESNNNNTPSAAAHNIGAPHLQMNMIHGGIGLACLLPDKSKKSDEMNVQSGSIYHQHSYIKKS